MNAGGRRVEKRDRLRKLFVTQITIAVTTIAARSQIRMTANKNQRMCRSVLASVGSGLFSGCSNISMIILFVCSSRKEGLLWDCYASLGIVFVNGHSNPLCNLTCLESVDLLSAGEPIQRGVRLGQDRSHSSN